MRFLKKCQEICKEFQEILPGFLVIFRDQAGKLTDG